MRVVFVNKYYYPPHLGGVEQVLSLLAVNLAKRPGVEVSAVVANEGPSTVTETIEGVRVIRAGRTVALANTPFAFALRRELRREVLRPEPADIVHLHYPYPWGELSWLYSGLDTPSVMSYHADVVRQKRLMALYAPFLRRALERVDRIVVSSPNLAEHSPYLQPFLDKVRVVPFGIDLTRFEHDAAAEQAVARLLEGVEGPITTFVGRLVYYKGVDVLLRAMVDVPGTLVIVGNGPLDTELRQLADELGIAGRVLWVEPLPDLELGALYRASDVFCLPSVARSEAFGLVQTEAQYAGVPVVSTNLPTGVPFANLDGVTGLTVTPGDVAELADALKTLHSDDALRARLGRQARERVLAEFSLDAMVDATLNVYREATTGRTMGAK